MRAGRAHIWSFPRSFNFHPVSFCFLRTSPWVARTRGDANPPSFAGNQLCCRAYNCVARSEFDKPAAWGTRRREWPGGTGGRDAGRTAARVGSVAPRGPRGAAWRWWGRVPRARRPIREVSKVSPRSRASPSLDLGPRRAAAAAQRAARRASAVPAGRGGEASWRGSPRLATPRSMSGDTGTPLRNEFDGGAVCVGVGVRPNTNADPVRTGVRIPTFLFIFVELRLLSDLTTALHRVEYECTTVT